MIRLNHDQLRNHAAKIEIASKSVAQAADATGTVHLDGQAFGRMCAWVPPVFSSLMPTQTGGIRASAHALDWAHDALNWAADDMQDTDDEIAATMNRLMS